MDILLVVGYGNDIDRLQIPSLEVHEGCNAIPKGTLSKAKEVSLVYSHTKISS